LVVGEDKLAAFECKLKYSLALSFFNWNLSFALNLLEELSLGSRQLATLD
jgi:hypothetical protein